ncbi:MAG: GlsB/YeaQ/YmgE family stress response membrane protein, partial [Ruthenibacterium sp.]
MLLSVLVSIAIGAVAGWLAGMIMNDQGGLVRNIIVGVVGSVIGGVTIRLIGFSANSWIAEIIV